jgi:hypothetical protein
LQNPAGQIQLIFVSLLAVGAWVRPLPRPRQLMVSMLALIAVSAIVLAQLSSHSLRPAASETLRDWLPAGLLLVPYWQIGGFFIKPDPQMEVRLTAFDQAFFRILRIQPAKVSIGTAAGVYLELAYLMVYPLIPLGLAAIYLTHLQRFANYYWIVVLPSTYTCYAVTPFVRAMPPRVLSYYPKFRMPASKIGMLNHWILRRASIQATTFPSAHVASSVAAALVLLRLEPSVGLIFLGISLSIALATIVGGYHYAADVLLAVPAAVLVFLATYALLRPA